jgi:uncharacterized protein YcaQ
VALVREPAAPVPRAAGSVGPGHRGGARRGACPYADLGPVTTADLGGAKSGNGVWWDWSPLKVATEQLLASGEVVCVERRGWRRVYELTERVVPAELRAQAPPDDLGCAAHLVALAAERLGVATLGDLADYFRLPVADARAGIEAAGLARVAVEGWTQPAWADPGLLSTPTSPARFRPVLLSPFDSLLWDRRRAERTLGFVHRLEAYVPRELREHGYFVMPLLAGGRIRGRVDPVRRGHTLVARRVSVERGAVPAMAPRAGGGGDLGGLRHRRGGGGRRAGAGRAAARGGGGGGRLSELSRHGGGRASTVPSRFHPSVQPPSWTQR